MDLKTLNLKVKDKLNFHQIRKYGWFQWKRKSLEMEKVKKIYL